MRNPSAETPVAVVGCGLAGLSAALAFASSGIRVALVGPPVTAAVAAADTRTTALFGGSIDFLRRVGAWEALEAGAAPLRGLRLIDDTGALIRAPEVLFEAGEIGLEAFGYNFSNGDLLQSLWTMAEATPLIRHHAGNVAALQPGVDAVRLALGDGSCLTAGIVVGADGAQSLCRAAAGISVRHRDYPQAAIATRFDHNRPHDDISTEFHRRPGPLTTVPLPGRASSLVWVETTAEVEHLTAMSDAHFSHLLEERLQGVLGHVSAVSRRVAFPLSGLTASSLTGQRIVLVGEAGHRIPPIGAQGLNLGLRDVAWIVELVGEAIAEQRDPGGDAVLASFEAARRSDVLTRTAAVDALNRSLFSDLLVADIARSVGIGAIASVPWLRRIAMRAGVGPGDRQPRLLQPEP